ncbi:hypothetical protein VK792_12450 [Mesobacterium sp. TK19101]|uniref:Uncharacterized protein n=1 Tax=Mesobacterium hydrothermale TaxID=3111907 RepID=A0ABU6HID3_9RHOB|nr:hypothetical protein [Mesobacterium sp. TK19101]MEC3862096.1 hypothetical protein [Mesobacterium sp. TK19101]
MDREGLDRALLKAHADQDMPALVQLYTRAADDAEAHQDIDAACFYLTHAFVFALEAGDPAAPGLNRRLAERGRAHLIEF